MRSCTRRFTPIPPSIAGKPNSLVVDLASGAFGALGGFGALAADWPSLLLPNRTLTRRLGLER
jgi:hypothetical protein